MPALAASSSSAKTIFLLITDGGRIRNTLFSDVFSLLRQRNRIVLFVPAPDVESIRREFGGDGVFVEPTPNSRLRFESKFTFVRRFLVSNPARNRTASVFSTTMKKHEPFNYALVRYVNPWLGRSRLVRDLWLKFEAMVGRGQEFQAVFDRYQPDLVVSTDYGSQRQEIHLLRYAHHRGVKTASIVYSWDNLSSKGIMGCRPQKLIVWNEIMRQEAAELHDIPPEDVFVCGAAQFDAYGRREEFLSRAAFCAKLGLDPAKPIIVQGTITPKYYAGNSDVLDILARAIAEKRFSRDCQILVRLHPQTVDKGGQFADELEPYYAAARKYPFIRVDRPETISWGSLVTPTREDAKHLAEILHHAAVLIHPGSTLVVDASAIDCPSIGLGFDGYTEKPYDESIRRWWDYTYMQPILRAGGQPVATGPDHLVGLINDFLKDRNHLSEGRARIRDWECHKVDGQSSRRVVAALESLLGN